MGLKAKQDFKPNSTEKYLQWTHNNEIATHNINNFEVKSGTNDITSKFKSAFTGVTIKNYFPEYPTIDGGTLFFRDPWFIDFPDPAFNGSLRNGGMDQASWRNRTSPFYPDAMTSYENAQKYNGVFLNQTPDPNNWLKPFYSVWAGDQMINLGSPLGIRTALYQKWSSNEWATLDQVGGDAKIIFTGGEAVVSANYKIQGLSNSADAYSNNSQRKFIRTPDGLLYIAYESMNKIWVEKSTDNGNSWAIVTGFGGDDYAASQISLDYFVENNNIWVTFVFRLDRDPADWVKWLLIKNGSFYNPNGDLPQTDDPLVEEYRYNPVVASNSNGEMFFVWETEIDGTKRLQYFYGVYSEEIGWSNMLDGYFPVSGVGAKTPTIAVKKTSGQPIFHLAWEENSQIKYCEFNIVSGSINILYQTTISNSSGYSTNHKPSLTVLNSSGFERVRLSWIGERVVYYWDEELETDQFYIEKRVVFRAFDADGVPPLSTFWNFGNNVNSTSINSTTDVNYIVGWSQNSGAQNQYVRNTTLSQVKTIKKNNVNLLGSDLQIANGDNFSTLYASVFNSASLPYTFSSSDPVSVLGKETGGNIIAAGREGIISRDNAQFYFVMGDVNVDGQGIDFVSVEESTEILDVLSLNSLLRTVPFVLTDNSNFIYSVQYGITDSLSAMQVLASTNEVSFKVRLIDDLTGEVLGIFDEITYSGSDLGYYNNISYEINTEGIGNKTVRLELVTANNFDPVYSISTKYSEDFVVAKINPKQVSFKGLSQIESYEIAQNYPNPFNPSTVINYQIPKDGLVTIKVYDILGKEITTLVNENKSVGRYSVQFNGDNLASGVYIYRINSGDFVSSKKMMLIK